MQVSARLIGPNYVPYPVIYLVKWKIKQAYFAQGYLGHKSDSHQPNNAALDEPT